MKSTKTNAAVRAAVESVMKDAAGAIYEADALAPCMWFNPEGMGTGTCQECPFYPESRDGSDCFRAFIREILYEAAERTAANLGK